jgi:hypothetical protein
VPTSGIADTLNHQLFEIGDRKPPDNRGSMSNRQCMDMDDDAFRDKPVIPPANKHD